MAAWPGSSAEPTCFPSSTARTPQSASGPIQLPARPGSSALLATGELWLFLLQFPLANLCMCVLFAWTASGPDPLVAGWPPRWSRCGSRAPPHPGLHRLFQGDLRRGAGSVPAHEQDDKHDDFDENNCSEASAR
jgi:hypothetical protein